MMRLRNKIRTVITGVALLALSSNVHAEPETFPVGTVRIVNTNNPGNGPDVIGRIAAEFLSRRWKQPAIVLNHPGAFGAIGMRVAASAKPDGHTILQAMASSFFALPEVMNQLPHDLIRDFVPIGLVGEQPMAIAASSTLQASTLKDFFELGKKRPGGLNVAVLARGSLPHMTMEWLRSVSGSEMTAVHYSSGAQSINDAIAGRIDLVIEGLPGLLGPVAGGKLKLIAVASAERLSDFPDIPAVAETFPGFRALGWFALMTPPGTPKSIAQKMSDDLRLVLSIPDLQKRYRDLGTYVRPLGPDELTEFAQEEQRRWKPIIDRIGLAQKKE